MVFDFGKKPNGQLAILSISLLLAISLQAADARKNPARSHLEAFL